MSGGSQPGATLATPGKYTDLRSLAIRVQGLGFMVVQCLRFQVEGVELKPWAYSGRSFPYHFRVKV